MVCFLPLGSIKRHVNSSTEAETICSLIWVRGNVASKVRISSFNTFKQAILLLNGNEFRLKTLHYSLYFSLASSYTKQALFRDKVCLIMKIFFLWIAKEREQLRSQSGVGSNRGRARHKWNQIVYQVNLFSSKCKQNIINWIKLLRFLYFSYIDLQFSWKFECFKPLNLPLKKFYR